MTWKTNPLPLGAVKPDAPPSPPPSPPPVNVDMDTGDSGPKVAEYLIDKIRELENELKTEQRYSKELLIAIEIVFESAHRNSRGPADPDTLWEIREMLKNFI